MTLHTETAALLDGVNNAMTNLTSPTQLAHLSADERKTALRQLLVTVEAAGKLAEVARVEEQTAQGGAGAAGASGGGWDAALTERIGLQTARIKAEMEKGV